MSLTAPAPVISEYDRFVVVRDDLVLGGTKARVVPGLMAASGAAEWVFAGASGGYAQVALGIGVATGACKATFFCPARKQQTPLTALAGRLGVAIREVPAGRLSVLEARARSYSEQTGALRPQLGLDVPGIREAIVGVARAVPYQPSEVWVAAGSGLLAQSLARAWPQATVCAVQVGAAPSLPPGARLFVAPEGFADPAAEPPPFPSVASYDSKVWRFASRYGKPGALIWNVAGPCPPLWQVDACLAAGSLSLAAYA